MKRQNQFKAFVSLFAQLSIPLLAVALGAYSAPAGPISSNVLLAQVVESLPPPPPPINFAEEELPSTSFSPREFDFQPPLPGQARPNAEGYLVYVNEDSSTQLQQVRQLEPTAFVRQYNGRSVIQAGTFSQRYNAQQRLKELKSRGIEARLVSLATGEETDVVDNSKYYFVVIPASREKLPSIEDQIRKLRTDISVNVGQRRQPRGSHVRVGPFSKREQAESWNHYLLDFGLKKARVYYGR